jgi:multicomponent Na+:H+ antiporter subunit F
MKYGNWLAILLVIGACLVVNFIFIAIPLTYQLLNVLLFCVVLLVVKMVVGPSAADRIVVLNIFGMVLIGVCAFMAVIGKTPHFIDIAIAWALQSFIGTIALAKLLEGRSLDE